SGLWFRRASQSEEETLIVTEHAEIGNATPNGAEVQGGAPGAEGHLAQQPRPRAAVWTKADLIAVVLVTAALLLVYLPELRWLTETWARDPNYSHGFLVFPVALVILWRRMVAVDPRLTRSRPV